MPDEPRQEDKEAREQRIIRNVHLELAIPFGILLVIFLIVGLYSFVGPTTPTEKKDFVQAVGVLVAGIAGVVGLIFTWRNLRLTRENTEKQLQATRENTEKQLQVAREGQERTQETTRETLRITEQGQITERFTRVIDQLGATDDNGRPRLEIRLGGIYALERIAKDSRERDYSTVMEVLTAYARENAPYTSREEAAEQEEAGEQDKADEPQKVAFPQEQRAAIRAIADVIRRLHEEDGVTEEHLVRLDLHNTNLLGANLRGANLRGANLSEANLSEANLSRVILMGSDLSRADLQGAELTAAILRGVDFSEANLSRANLSEADLFVAKELTQEQLEQANGDATTALPEGREMPKSWTKGEREQTEEDK